jgi:nucleoside-diphosphate-sugar epimerase
MTKTILVTGAGGCVGGFVVDELLAAGHAVVATDRPALRASREHPRLDWKPADLTDPRSAPGLVEGVDAVIHTAAWVDIAASFEAQAPINLYAVRYLFDAALARGVKYFLHFSTGSLYAPKLGALTEEDPLLPTSGYERAKLLAEDYLRTHRGSTTVNIVRPALIYGPRGRVLLAPLATLPTLLSPFARWLPRIKGGPRTNVVHALDVARAAVHLLAHPHPDGATFNVATPEVLPAGEILATVFEVAGFPRARLELPFPTRAIKRLLPALGYPQLFVAFNAAARTLWSRTTRDRHLEEGLVPRLDMEATVYLAGDTVFDVNRLLSTGFQFRFPTFAAGWADTMSWYRSHHWIPSDPAPEPAARAVA